MLGQTTIPHGGRDDLLLRLLVCHLGTGMSSLLFRKLREENGVAYEVGAHHPIRAMAAPFILHASTSGEKSMLTLQLLSEAWFGLKSSLLSEKELQLAKAKFRGVLAHSSQTSAQHAERRVQLRSLGLSDDYDFKSIDEIETVTSKELQQIAVKLLGKPLLSLCGPNKSINKLAEQWINQQ